jgi:hypothetical protein
MPAMAKMVEPEIAKGYVGLVYLQQAVAMLPLASASNDNT